MSDMFNDWNQRIIDTFRANAGEVPQFGRSLVPVSYTHLTLPTNREV